MPTILTKKSDTPGAIPATANLTNAAGGAELAVNTADKRLFTITSGSQVVELGTNPASLTCADVSATVLRAGSATITNLIATTATVSDLSATVARISSLTISSLSLSNATFGSATITNLTSTSATISSALTLTGGTANGVLYLNASKVATSGSNITFDGTDLRMPNGGSMLVGASASGGSILLINGTAAAQRLVLGTSGTDAIINATRTSGTSPNLLFQIESTEGMRLTSTGLGIGTSSPATKLDVNGDVTQRNGSGTIIGNIQNSSGWYDFKASANVNGAQISTAAATPIRFLPNGVEAARFDSSGNLGIGTSSPAEKLDVYSAAGTAAIKLQTASNIAYSINSQIPGVANDGFAIRDVTNSVNRLVIDSSGNLGIGTSTPAAKLDVNGTIYSRTGGVYTDTITAYSGSSISLNAGSSHFAITVNGSERARFDSSGNLGLGVTPSAWQSTRRALQVGGSGALWASATGAGTLFLSNNTYFDGSNFVYLNTSSASYLAQQTDGAFTFNQAASGTAGNTITFTQAMTLDASGNLGVGTTSPSLFGAGYKTIQVTGTSGAGVFQATSTNVDVRFQADQIGVYALINVASNHPLVFNTNATERARITSGGYFKASNNGTYTSSTGAYAEFYQSANDIGLIVRNQNASNTGNVIEAAADRNTTNNSYYFFRASVIGVAYRFQVADSGDVTNTNGTYGTISDAKMKTDIVDAGSQWADIKGLRFRKFKMKDDPSGLTQLGVVAQEVEQVSPGLVDEHTDRDAEGNDLGTTTKSVKTSVLLMKAAVALQEAMARIEKLEAEMAALKGA